jgi:amino acid transporter
MKPGVDADPPGRPRDADEATAARPRHRSVLQLAGAVFWAFFGVRKSSAQADDVKHLKPVHVIIAGVIGALIFIAVLIIIVNWVVGSGVAGAR